MTIARGYGSLWVRPLLSHLFVYFIYFLLINFFFFYSSAGCHILIWSAIMCVCVWGGRGQ